MKTLEGSNESFLQDYFLTDYSYLQGFEGSRGGEEEDGGQGCRQRRHGERRRRRDRGWRHEVASQLSPGEGEHIRSNFDLSHSRTSL